MAFLAGVLVSMMVFLSIPAFVGVARSRDMYIANWRLARTCVVGMLILGSACYWMMFSVDEFSSGQSLAVFIGVVFFSFPAGAYMNTLFEHSLEKHSDS